MASRAATAEREFQRTIVEALEMFGYAGVHVFPLMDRFGRYRTPTTAPGWPDLVYLREPRLLAIEVKLDGVTVPPLQRAWLTLFSQMPCCRAWVIRPSKPDWTSAVVEWIRRPGPAPRAFGFEPVDDPVGFIQSRGRKRGRR